MKTRQSLFAAGLLALALSAPFIAIGCAQKAEAKKLDVTYYYLPG